MDRTVIFSLAGMTFEYDEEKNQKNIEKHKISLRTAARVFFDNICIEREDNAHSIGEERYQLIGDLSAGGIPEDNTETAASGNAEYYCGGKNDILYVVYTERERTA